MKKFVFTMQSLLNVKIALEKQQKAELSEANGRLARFRQALLAREEAFGRARAEAEEKVRRGMSAREVKWRGAGFRALFTAIEEERDKVFVAEEECRRLQKRLVDTMAERKMLERLREKQWAEYQEEGRRSEAAMIDDFLSNQLSKR